MKSGRFETWIGGRYVRSRSRNSFISLISAISMLGIAIAVAIVLILVYDVPFDNLLLPPNGEY